MFTSFNIKGKVALITGATVGVLYPGWGNTNIAKSALGADKKAQSIINLIEKRNV